MVKDQDTMWKNLQANLDLENIDMKNSFNGKLEPRPTGCSLEKMCSTVEFPALDWELNQAGQVHGGILCTMFDISAGSLAKTLNEVKFNPTISIDVKFLRPAMHGDTVIINTKVNANGRTLAHMYAEASSKETGKILATAVAVFMNKDTRRTEGENK